MTKRALYPGSFDPFTIAHYEIVKRALTIFDKVVIAVGYNISKQGFLSKERRKELIERCFEGDDRVEVILYSSLTTSLCSELNINHIIRGIRGFSDFESESTIADINTLLAPEIMTLYLTSSKEHNAVSSSAVREIYKFGGDVSPLLPGGITAADLKEK